WDLDNNGTFGAVGPTVTFAAGDRDGTHNYTVGLSMSNSSTPTHVRVTVTNVAPTAQVIGPTVVFPGESNSFVVSATDPSRDDLGLFLYHVEWGDGSFEDLIDSAKGELIRHTYQAPGLYTVQLTAWDQDLGQSAPATLTVQVIGRRVATWRGASTFGANWS